MSIDEDYYKPKITNNAFNNNYIQYESKGNKDTILTINTHLDIIRPYLSDIINDSKTQDEWKIHSCNTITEHKTQGEWKTILSIAINSISSKEDSDETRTMHAKKDNIEIMMGSKKDEIIEELFKFLLQRHQEELEESMKGSEFIFDSVNVLYYDLNKISLNRSGSYINPPEWLKSKKATISPKNDDNKCFQYAITVALNYQIIKKDSPIITKIKPFTDQYNWKEINFPSNKKDWKKFVLNNKSIALNILFILHNTEKIRHAHKSKHSLSHENQVLLLMIPDR